MEEQFASNYLPIVISYLKGNIQPVEPKQDDFFRVAVNNATGFEISEYGDDVAPEDAPEDSIAIIDISGVIEKHDQNCGPAGMITKSRILQRCYSNDNIKGIVLNIDSGGGSGLGMRLLTETISKRNKPIVAFVSDMAASAAYGIASGADIIVANSDYARVGSIGTYMNIVSYVEKFKKEGINIIEVYASASKDKNKDYYDALKGDTKAVQKTADTYNEMFLTMIETNREGKLTADRSSWGTGKMYFAPEALELGLIDNIDSFSNILNYFV
jgi:signal peptide peptidase SppA